MAKKPEKSPVVLFMAAAILLTAGWLMRSFPVFIFLAIAPLFALTDRASEDSQGLWEKMEWVLFALVISFLGARVFDFSFIVSSIVFAIHFTLPFVGHVWVHSVLGKRAGKVTVILLWLSLEYTLLKAWPGDIVFLADALALKPEWTKWTAFTGYLGSTAWILIANLMIYQAVLSEKSFQWPWIVMSFVTIAGPILYSYLNEFSPVTRQEMMNLYTGKSIIKDVTYLARGEYWARTSAWVSTLIILFAFVKSQTSKR